MNSREKALAAWQEKLSKAHFSGMLLFTYRCPVDDMLFIATMFFDLGSGKVRVSADLLNAITNCTRVTEIIPIPKDKTGEDIAKEYAVKVAEALKATLAQTNIDRIILSADRLINNIDTIVGETI